MLQVYIAFVALGLDPRRVEVLISDLVRNPCAVLVRCLEGVDVLTLTSCGACRCFQVLTYQFGLKCFPIGE